ncbi:chromosomal replication initiator DnaA [Cereibacter sphaeroides]|uniref:helix-turn-helix domain-containing protein n=1 Tax=Cereibacter sphaeroides TaxID=1063 RepID=UPI000F51D9C7|nr:helix-turn-helix domain-containing protein [Cereibacter sphaeroides]AZB65023.1 chromosomal replication initiator DnaA [Cereibacter sphaeroides]AZB67093.1 chromosomal replication initiator DnaA [Cereibacter sphaeroides]
MTPEDAARAAEIRARGYPARITEIIAEVAEATGWEPQEITGARVFPGLVQARDLACFIARREGFSLTQIGNVLRRDHSSIKTALQREQRRRGGSNAQ